MTLLQVWSWTLPLEGSEKYKSYTGDAKDFTALYRVGEVYSSTELVLVRGLKRVHWFYGMDRGFPSRTAKKIRIMYSQQSNCAALFPNSISVHLFCCSQTGRLIVGIYIYESLSYGCRN
jgi:hypothetical protein